MAEYAEVIRQFKRMCRYTNYSRLPQDCPLYCKGRGCNISHCRMLAFEDKKFANVVMAWAAEHPEPIYPTWYRWLIMMGAVGSVEDLFSELQRPIPADIAQKLGIEPKEDT